MAEHRRLSTVAFVAVGLLASVALVVLVAPRASSSPDGLEKVAADTGIDRDVRPHALGDGPFADYATAGVGHDALGTIAAGVLGIAVTFLVCLALVLVARRRRGPATASTAPPG